MCDRGTGAGMEQLRSSATPACGRQAQDDSVGRRGREKRTGLKTRHYGEEKGLSTEGRNVLRPYKGDEMRGDHVAN